MVFRTVPRFVERIWGRLPNPGGVPFGEIWWAWDDGTDSSSLAAPGGSGLPSRLHDLAPHAGRFPIVAKTLHPAGMLSLQVHPGLPGNGPRKAESWIFLKAPQGASVILGLRPGTTPGDLSAAVASGRPDPLLRSVPVLPGDILHVPPGTVHSLCGGVEVIEFQENCDVTYRIWDWGRQGSGGVTRETHMAMALESIDFSPEASSGQAGASCAGFGYLIGAVSGSAALPPYSVLFVPGGDGDAPAGTCFVSDGTGGSADAGEGGWMAEPEGVTG